MNDDNDINRRMVEQCYRTSKTLVNPIVDWSDIDVWNFLKYYHCELNPLYQCGFNRIGCIGCPNATKKKRSLEFRLYPKYRENYLRAFQRLLNVRRDKGLETTWRNASDVMKWWLEEDVNQLTFDDLEK